MAFKAPTVKWVEQSDLTKLCAAFVYGGIAVDSLDCTLQHPERLASLRNFDPLLVVGNAVGKRGGSYEIGVYGFSRGNVIVLELLEDIANKIVARTEACRGNGPHWTIQESYVAWAERKTACPGRIS